MKLIGQFVFYVAGVSIMVGCTCYHVVERPEWTAPQALVNQWPGYVMALVLFALATLLGDIKDDDDER